MDIVNKRRVTGGNGNAASDMSEDLVHEKNYQTRELLQKTIEDWDLARNLLNPRGYRELLGTRYDWSDLYGDIQPSAATVVATRPFLAKRIEWLTPLTMRITWTS